MRMRISALLSGIALLSFTASSPLHSAEKAKDDKVVKDGSVVSLQYSLSGEDGKLIELRRDEALRAPALAQEGFSPRERTRLPRRQ